jgi:uncharacterized protein (DUF983 family)
MRASPLAALGRGVRGRCPACGKGKLFSGLLRLRPACDQCGADFSMADVGDGAAVFVILIVGALVVPVGMVVQLGFGWSAFATIALASALTIALCLFLLPAAKGALFALQWAHKAGEGRTAEPPDHEA